MITRFLTIIKGYQHGIFVGLCMMLAAGIGYNIGYGSAYQKSPLTISQDANIYNAASGGSDPSQTRPEAPIIRDSRVVASKASKSYLYHYSWCSGAKRIKEENKLWFESAAAAETAGYSLAGNCQ